MCFCSVCQALDPRGGGGGTVAFLCELNTVRLCHDGSRLWRLCQWPLVSEQKHQGNARLARLQTSRVAGKEEMTIEETPKISGAPSE